MRSTSRQLHTTAPHPPVTMVRCMGLYNPQNPVRSSAVRPPSVRPPPVRPPSVRPSYYYPNGWVCVTLQSAKPRQIVRRLGMLTHARSYLNPLSGIPEGSIDSIDRGSPRARSTRSIGDPLGLDRLDRLDRKSIGDRARSIDRLDRSGIP